MLSAGVQYGRLKRFTQTRMRKHLMSSNIKNMEIFNLDETNAGVEKVSEVIKKTIADGKKVIRWNFMKKLKKLIQKRF